MGLRLGEGLSLKVQDIDAHTMQIHIRNGKGGKDRLVPLPQRTLNALRSYWLTHRHPQRLFPGKEIMTDKPMDRGGVQKAMKLVLSVRDYGFLRGQARLLLCRIQLLLLDEFYLQPQSRRVTKSKAVRACPCCQHEMACVGITRPS